MIVPVTVNWGSLSPGAVAFAVNDFYIKTSDTEGTGLSNGAVNSNFTASFQVQSFPAASLKLD